MVYRTFLPIDVLEYVDVIMSVSRLFIPVLLLSLSITACGDKEEASETPVKEVKVEAPKEVKKEVKKEMQMKHSPEEMEEMQKLAVEKRVAFMSGHVVAGLTLYRAGAPDQAAKHLLHPVSETHAAERAGIDALGFKGDVFEAVSKALDEGKPAAEVEPMLKEAEENIALLQKNAGGDAADIIRFLMETVDEEYAIGVKEGKITDPGEYQDAFGFSMIALEISKQQNNADLVSSVEALVKMWPEKGPLADSTPTAVADVTSQTAKVVAALPSSEPEKPAEK